MNNYTLIRGKVSQHCSVLLHDTMTARTDDLRPILFIASFKLPQVHICRGSKLIMNDNIKN